MTTITINFKKISIFIIVLFYAFIASSCSNHKLKNNFDYVYVLESKTEDKTPHNGTCFYSNGRFYTNAHLILYKDFDEYMVAETIVAKDMDNKEKYELELVEYDISKDIAVLKANNISGNGLKIKKGYSSCIGEDVFTIGNLNNYGLAYGYGKITSNEKLFANLGTNICYIQTNIEISGGNSGGPVFNYSNEVIGIMSLKLMDNGQYVDGVSFFVNID
ncbi:MAG: serine protease [bacterium]|nr:serine protease [bacterium]